MCVNRRIALWILCFILIIFSAIILFPLTHNILLTLIAKETTIYIIYILKFVQRSVKRVVVVLSEWCKKNCIDIPQQKCGRITVWFEVIVKYNCNNCVYLCLKYLKIKRKQNRRPDYRAGPTWVKKTVVYTRWWFYRIIMIDETSSLRYFPEKIHSGHAFRPCGISIRIPIKSNLSTIEYCERKWQVRFFFLNFFRKTILVSE